MLDLRLRNPVVVTDAPYPSSREQVRAWLERVEADPISYEREAVAAVREPVAQVLQLRGAELQEVQLSGQRPETRLEVIFRHELRPDCLLGWRWAIWKMEHAPFHFEDIEIEVTTSLQEWLDLEAATVLEASRCEGDEIVWIKDL